MKLRVIKLRVETSQEEQGNGDEEIRNLVIRL